MIHGVIIGQLAVITVELGIIAGLLSRMVGA